VEAANISYGFKSKFKLKATIFSPAKGDILYPLFDATGDMIAFSREFSITEDKNTSTYFETWVSGKYYQWKQKGADWELAKSETLAIDKIPIIYSNRPQPLWDDGDNGKVEQLEKLLSENGDIIDYHAAPVLILKGALQGAPVKGESNKVFVSVDGTGGAEYVTWPQSPEAIKFQFESLLRLFWMDLQLPDLSYDNVKGIGATSGVALKLLFSDAHLKCGDESEMYEEIIEREYSVIKAYLGAFNTEWKGSIEDLSVEPEIRFYIVGDERERIEVLIAANGSKPLVSQEQSVQLAALSEDPAADFLKIQAEYAKGEDRSAFEPTY
jgi:hypothetical protein